MIHLYNLCQVNHPKNYLPNTPGELVGVFAKGAKEAIVTNHISSYLGVLGRGIKISLNFCRMFVFLLQNQKKHGNWGNFFEEQKNV